MNPMVIILKISIKAPGGMTINNPFSTLNVVYHQWLFNEAVMVN